MLSTLIKCNCTSQNDTAIRGPRKTEVSRTDVGERLELTATEGRTPPSGNPHQLCFVFQPPQRRFPSVESRPLSCQESSAGNGCASDLGFICRGKNSGLCLASGDCREAAGEARALGRKRERRASQPRLERRRKKIKKMAS